MDYSNSSAGMAYPGLYGAGQFAGHPLSSIGDAFQTNILDPLTQGFSAFQQGFQAPKSQVMPSQRGQVSNPGVGVSSGGSGGAGKSGLGAAAGAMGW